MASGAEQAGPFLCPACDMVFPTRMLRDSHARRFCIGRLTPEESPAPPPAALPRGTEGRTSQPPGGPAEASGATLKKLTDEVQRLRTSLQGRRPPPKAPPGAPAHLQEAHARRLAEIGAQAQSLEKLRAEVGQQLGSLAGGSGVLAQLMLAMQAHEERTQLALDALGDRVERLQARTPQGLPAGTKEDVAAPLGLQDLPASGGNLTSEIRALHTAYLQAGGRDPAVLAGVGELYLEAALLEGRPRQKRKARAGPRPPDTRLQTLDALNGQLEAEILALQIQRGGRRALQGLWEPQLRRGRGGSARLPPPVAPPLPPPPPGPPRGPPFPGMMEPPPGAAAQGPQLLPPPEVLGPAPYDPGAGFTIFYDFLLGLEPEWSQVQLVTGLARDGQESGPGTALPPRPCLPLPPTAGAPLGGCAILAARQPVPRLPPSPALSLVVELRVWGLWAGGRAQAWSSLQLFDPERRVLSGRWRLPLRALPRAPGLHPGQLNAIPQAGRTELYLRIANARDAEIQALAAIDPAQGPEYRYVPAGPSPGSLEDNRLNPHFLGPPSLLPSLSLADSFQDPPPAAE